MKAFCFDRFGPADQVLAGRDVDTPTPAAGEVLVRLYSSAVNPSDVKKRAGAFPDLVNDGFIIPHSDGAGEIVALGSGIASHRMGERVFVYQAQHNRAFGTAAEFVCLPSERAPVLPASVSYNVGACIGIPILTAHRCVSADGPVNGQWLLVTGGAGRVGFYAIQWAQHFGANIVATASNDTDATLCREAGAIAVVNHRDPDWATQLLEHTGGSKIDRVIDAEFGANLPDILTCIRVGGTIVSYGSSQVPEPTLPFRTMMFMDLTLRLVIVYDMPEDAKERAIADTQALLRRDGLQHRVAAVLPFKDLPKAHEIIEQGAAKGCVVIDITSND